MRTIIFSLVSCVLHACIFWILLSGVHCESKSPTQTIRLVDLKNKNQIHISKLIKTSSKHLDATYISAVELFENHKMDPSITGYIFEVRSLLLEAIRSIKQYFDVVDQSAVRVEFAVGPKGDIQFVHATVLKGRLNEKQLNQKLVQEFNRKVPFPIAPQQRDLNLPILFEFEIEIS